jgi:hypothetical protein
LGIRFSSIPKFKYTVPPLVVSDIIYQNQENLANSIKGGYSLKGGKGISKEGKGEGRRWNFEKEGKKTRRSRKNNLSPHKVRQEEHATDTTGTLKVQGRTGK